MFAPSAQASRGVLRDEGFASADTVARLLVDEKLQESLREQVIWVDEAGLLGTRTMAKLFDLAEQLNARLILSGDRKQHGSVERGSALRLLEEQSGLVPAQLREIRRQSGDYKRAVRCLSEGRTETGFAELDQLGWVREIDFGERYQQLAGDYVHTVEDGETALVVSPTHIEGEWVTASIRSALQANGTIKGASHEVTSLTNRNLTAAQRADASSYEPGDVLVFHQNAPGHRRGERVTVSGQPLPLEHAERFAVFRPHAIELAAGDQLRITRNGLTADGKHRLNNGATYALQGFTASGDLKLANGWTVPRDYGHVTYGYCTTSHAAQGRTVDRVFIAQSAQSAPASSQEQFYVSASRGRKQAVIYTQDKDELLAAVTRPDVQPTAIELLRTRSRGRVAPQPKLEPNRTHERAYG